MMIRAGAAFHQRKPAQAPAKRDRQHREVERVDDER